MFPVAVILLTTILPLNVVVEVLAPNTIVLAVPNALTPVAVVLKTLILLE
jgi:hypothetical protein